MKIIYVAGKYSAPTLEEKSHNLDLADQAGREVLKAGFYPIVPHKNSQGWEDDKILHYEDCMKMDFAIIAKCDGLLLISESSGSLRERDHAKTLGIPIFNSIDELKEYKWDTELRGHPKFYTNIEEMKMIHHKKNHDYSSEKDPLSNLKMCETLEIAQAEKGVLIRITDKVSRLIQLLNKGKTEVKDESIHDTCMDLANYANLLDCLLYDKRYSKVYNERQ